MGRLADVDVRLLRVFRAVAECGGLAAAQSVLDTSTSTISLHISELERRLGFKLCQRGRAGFELTDRGKATYERALRLLNTIDDNFNDILSLKKRLTGKVRLGMVDALMMHPHMPLAAALRDFNQLDNDVEVQLMVDDRTQLERRLLEGELHAAISTFVRPVAGLAFHRVMSERHRVYCGQGHPLYGVTAVQDTAALAPYPFILRSYWGRTDAERFQSMNIRATANNMEAMTCLLLSGNYLGLLPEYIAEERVKSGTLHMINAPDLEQSSHHCLVLPSTASTSLAMEALVPLILGQVNEADMKEPAPPFLQTPARGRG
ncbi:LysR family transcriptional regulator [Acetobacter sp. TBRC 12305]|uniref:LysR family transcriptional regulator n=1 Tax=Acetobacter garciniae TaxID=2817435 RepID=A0A939KQM7_9PROT|nr:LysR family transcriptional regulator [Acetobacter garciniae]MBO1325557.1 LysR family transcriptional regulator [Acetobacter garciniae]MBX0345271.1 LysR family transcriptional regulator [Acetobacter garciniae]